MKNVIWILVAIISFGAVPAHAALTPLAVSIVPPVQFPPDDFDITGFRFSLIYGRHRDVYGIDLGVIGNVTKQNFVGIGISGGFNYTEGMVTALGIQAAGVANINKQKASVYGVQFAGITNMNYAESSVTGLQLSLVNFSPHTTIYGVQTGLYNKALTVYGLQIGLINQCESLHGLQIGLLNFHAKGMFSVSPILNFGF